MRFWRTRDGQEIDLLVEHQGRVHPVEVKLGMPSLASLPRLASIAVPNWERGQVVTLAIDVPQVLSDDWFALPPWNLRF